MSTFTGRLFYPGEEGFDEAAVGRVFNGRRPERRPNAVLLAENENDLIAGVALAQENGWEVAVRSGGHSWAAWSVRTGTLLIDLGLLQEMTYDPETGIASASPAIKGGGVLTPYLQEQGRFFNGGHCPTVGIGGFLLQGGQGWIQRGWGWAAENVVAVDVLTAEGKIVRADAQQNTDLYWAARGAGPSFPGIVTKFHIQTRPLYKHAFESVQIFELEEFDTVMAWLYEVDKPRISEDIELVVVSVTIPGEDGEPRRVFVVDALTLVDSPEEAAANLSIFQENPAIERAFVNKKCDETTLAARREDQNRANPEHWRYVVDNIWVDGETTEIIEKIAPLFTDLPEPAAFTIWYSNGLMRPLPDMAFSLQSPAYVATYLLTEDASHDASNRQWLNRAMAHAESVTVGQYLGDSDMGNRQLKFMADENYAKLQEIIARRDPEGRFVRYLAADPATVNKNHWEL